MRAKWPFRLLLLSLLLLGACVGLPNRSTPPPQGAATPTDPSQYPEARYLTSVDWLAAHRDDPGLRIVDASPLGTYEAGHIPGAVHLWWQDTIELHNHVYGMLTGEAGRAELIRAAGITPESQVVIYDDSGGRYAARILWMLNAIGFDRASILNGGRQAWIAAGEPLSRSVPEVPPGHLDQQLDYGVLIGAADLHQHLDDGTLAIVDNRTTEEWAETWFGRLREGQIPGAVSIPWSALTEPGPVPYVVAPERLRALFADAGVTPDDTVVVYGLDGVSAAQTYVALRLLGYPSVRVYDGSWAEWGADAALPIAPLAAGHAAS